MDSAVRTWHDMEKKQSWCPSQDPSATGILVVSSLGRERASELTGSHVGSLGAITSYTRTYVFSLEMELFEKVI